MSYCVSTALASLLLALVWLLMGYGTFAALAFGL